MKIVIDRQIRCRDVPSAIKAVIIDELTIENPQYEKAAAMNISIWNIPRQIRLYEYDGSTLVIPRGYLDRILDLTAKSNVEIEDHRTELKKIAFQSNIKLRGYQAPAVDAAIRGEQGVIIMPCGSGKTETGEQIIADIGQPTLWITHTKDLLNQSLERAKTKLNLKPGEYGVIAGTEFSVGSHITFGMVQTLANRRLNDLADRVGCVVVDECLVGDTLVALEDGGIRRIDKIADGAGVLGGTVSGAFSKEAETAVIRTTAGEIETSLNHPNFVVRGIGSSYAPGTPTGTKVEVLQTKDLEKGMYLLSPREVPHSVRYNWTPAQLGLVALIMMDGHIPKDKHASRVMVTVRTDREWYRKVFLEGIRAFGLREDDMKESFNHRGDYTVWTNSARLKETLTKTFQIPAGKKFHRITINDQILYSSKEAVKRFIDVTLSCKRWFYKEGNQAGQISLDICKKDYVIRMQHLLKKFGIYSYYLKQGKNSKHNEQYRIKIGEADLKVFAETIGLSNPSKQSMLEDMIKTDSRFEPEINFNGQRYRLVRIKEVDRQKQKKTVYDFTTTTHGFVANNLLTHNCHRCFKDHKAVGQFYSVISQLPARYRIGLTASEHRSDGLIETMFLTIGPKLYEVTQDDLSKTGYVITPTVYFVPTPFTFDGGAVGW